MEGQMKEHMKKHMNHLSPEPYKQGVALAMSRMLTRGMLEPVSSRTDLLVFRGLVIRV